MLTRYDEFPVHQSPYPFSVVPVTDRAARRSVSLPMYPGLGETDQATVIEAVRVAFERHRVEELAAR